MSYVKSGVADTTTSGKTPFTLTVPSGITSGMTMIVFISASVSAPDHLICTKTGATITPLNSTQTAWGTSASGAATCLPKLTTNSFSAMWKLTGVVAGDVVTITPYTSGGATVAVLGDVHHWYHDGDIPSLSTFAVKSGTTTVAPALTVTSGQKCFVVSYSRASGITLSSVVNSNTGPPTVTTDYSRLDGTTSPICITHLFEFTPPGTSSGTTTSTYNTSNTNGGAFTYTEAASLPPAAALTTPPRAGGRTATTVKVLVDATNATAAVVTAATNTGLTTGVVTSSSVTLDGDGLGIASLSGLTPGTDYYLGVSLDGVAQAGRGNFRTAQVGAYSYSFWLTSCLANGSNPTTLDSIRTRVGTSGKTANFGVMPGDIHYQGRNTSNTSVILADWRDVLSRAKAQALFSAMAVEYTWSDHDLGPDQCDSVVLGTATIAANRATFARYWPTYPLVDPAPYRSWIDGRVYYILTEGRTYMTAINGTDNSSKTKLGSTQLAWLFSEMLKAKNMGLAIAWLHEDGGQTGTSTFTNDDSWAAFTYEAGVIHSFLVAHGLLTRVGYIHGDYHAMSYDDGTNCLFGIPSICASPLDQDWYMPTQAHWTGGVYPATNPGGIIYQYGWFEVADTGGRTLAINFTGYSNDNTGGTSADTSRMTATMTLDAWAPVSIWNGSSEVVPASSIWDGTTEHPVEYEAA